MKRRRRNYTRFVDLSRHKQRDLYIRLRWKILRESPEKGGMFSSFMLPGKLNGQDTPDQWYDFEFLGRDGHSIFNATILTAQQAVRDEVCDLAWHRARAMLTEHEREYEFHLRFERRYDSNGEKFYGAVWPEPRYYEVFGGLTFREYWVRSQAEILKNDPPAIHESYHLDQSYCYGIGLEMVVEAQGITQDIIERAIQHFREIGEQNWRNPQPVPREHLNLLAT